MTYCMHAVAAVVKNLNNSSLETHYDPSKTFYLNFVSFKCVCNCERQKCCFFPGCSLFSANVKEYTKILSRVVQMIARTMNSTVVQSVFAT